MRGSLIYMVLRGVVRMLIRLARDDGAKDIELLVWRASSGHAV
jgi:hypothetical protein